MREAGVIPDNDLKLSIIAAIALLAGLLCGALILHSDLASSIIGLAPNPSALRLGRLVDAITAAIITYGVVIIIAVTIAFILDMASIERQLSRFIVSGNASVMTHGEWDHVFFGTLAEPLAFRLVSRANAEGNGFCLAAPFSPAAARAEIWRFYHHQLIRTQFWPVLGILVLTSLVIREAGPILLPSLTGLINPWFLKEGILLLVLFGAGCVAAAYSLIERFLNILSSFPFKLDTSLQLRSMADRVDGSLRDMTRLFAGQDYPLVRRDPGIATVPEQAPVLTEANLAKLFDQLVKTFADRLENALRSTNQVLHQPAVPSLSGDELRVALQEYATELHQGLQDNQKQVLDELSDLVGSIKDLSEGLAPHAAELHQAGDRVSLAAGQQEAALDRLGYLLTDLAGTVGSVDATLQQKSFPDPIGEDRDIAAPNSTDVLARLRALERELETASQS